MSYTPTIGLEIHVELNTESKMFCSCKNDSKERKPNTNVCPICMGHPGVLPVINEEAVKKVIKTGLALNCQISEYSKFDRKNYFYPDLPKGYQISQYDMPIARNGALKFKIQDSKFKTIRIRRVHLEEDTGRLIHPKGVGYSLVDFNRAGIPLMELVTDPDLHLAEEARRFAEELQLILRYLGVSNADMEKGELRVEANISLKASNRKEEKKLGTKVEIKNLNSFRILEKALNYEIERQEEILRAGKKVIQETRGWDDNREVTLSQREKEQAHDYRYFPEPDLPPLHFIEDYITKIKAEIPELPQQKRERFKKEYRLDEKSIEVFIQNKDLGEYFEKVINKLEPNFPAEKLKLTTNYIITDVQGTARAIPVISTQDINRLIPPEHFAEFISLIYDGKISSKIAKTVLKEMVKTGTDPSQIIEEKGLSLITNEAEIKKIVEEVVAKNKKAVEDFKKGKIIAIQHLIGQVMRETKGRADPKAVENLLKDFLNKLK